MRGEGGGEGGIQNSVCTRDAPPRDEDNYFCQDRAWALTTGLINEILTETNVR